MEELLKPEELLNRIEIWSNAEVQMQRLSKEADHCCARPSSAASFRGRKFSRGGSVCLNSFGRFVKWISATSNLRAIASSCRFR